MVARDQPLISKFLDYDLAFDLDDDFLVSKLGVIHNPDETHPDTLQHEFTPSSDQHLTSHRESPRTPSFNVVTSSLENETVPPRNVLSVLNKTTHVNSVPHLVESSIPLIPTTLPAPLIQPNLLTSLLNKSLPIIPLTSLFDEFPLNPVTSDDQQTPIIPVISKEDQPIRYIPKSSSSIPSSLFPPYPDTIPEILDFESIDKTVKEDMMRVEIDFARGHATLCSSQKILLLLSCFFAVLIQR
ncbi:hypothetical protein SK128_015769 [Halocaridina rubra]|uniref:Uncharacterized protein n=1 Tax=Halocaridina rubra TaxID=373956 RepID=A0AAN8X4U3_HALRR